MKRLRVAAVLVLCAGYVLVAASCQKDQPAAQRGGGTPGSRANTSDAAAASRAATTMPAGTRDPNGNLLTPEARALGFTFAAAPEKHPGDLAAANATCVACHGQTDAHTMHATNVSVSCVGCHGGNATVNVPMGISPGHRDYAKLKGRAHPKPRLADLWKQRPHGGNPEISAAAVLRESPDYIRFVNPGDLRAALVSCGSCHNTEAEGHIVDKVDNSMMAHGAMLWGAALYNNGSINRKQPVYGEFYGPGENPKTTVPGGRIADPLPTVHQNQRHGVLAALWPLTRWEVTQPGNILRVFERGGKFRQEIGIPEELADPGRPDAKLSLRDFGTDLRTDPVSIGLQKTRLFDPTLNFMGTNDHPGDYRGSGCSACHVVYANDRSPVHSSLFANFGNRGESFSSDPTVNPPVKGATTRPVTDPLADPWAKDAPRRERGHPVKHVMVKNPPSSSCISCHVHPGTLVLNSYLGFMWWDNETDGRVMYPSVQRDPSPQREFDVSQHNPEQAAARGLWGDRKFLEDLGTPEFNEKLKRTHFADFHGHGWVFRAVYKQDRHGRMLDHAGREVKAVTPQKMAAAVNYTQDPERKPEDDKAMRDGHPVHLKDIHLEKGMQCADCHFKTDTHGDGRLYGETRAATTITCEDCHGTVERPAALFSYLSDRGGAKADAFAAAAFSGNAAKVAAGVDELQPYGKSFDELADRIAKARQRQQNNQQLAPRDRSLLTLVDSNKRTIEQHFELDEAVFPARLVQNSAMAREAAKEPWKQAAEATAKSNGGKIPGMVKSWPVVQTADTSRGGYKSPGAPDDTARADRVRYAHSVRKGQGKDGKLMYGGDVAADEAGTNVSMKLAHASNKMNCYACHTSWNTSCFGCHLPQRANQRKENLHNEGTVTRNYTNYNYQTLRDDVYMLGVDGTTKDNKVSPIRSACAVLVSSQDALRQWVYVQQQTVSAEGFSGTAFSPYFPHTVRSTETKTCTDCHVSRKDDNNAIMAQLMLQGTNAVNFIGRFAWVGTGGSGLEAVVVTERGEPQAVIGSRLHEIAYPKNFAKHKAGGWELEESHTHHHPVLDLQLRGEYLYAAAGDHGFIAFDVANIDNKGFSERIVTAPVSPLGQRFFVKSKYATSICSPSTLAIDPTRQRRPENLEGRITEIGNPANVIEASRPIHPMYAYLYLTDREEGLIVIGNPADSPNKPGVSTLLDGDPENNFLQRALTWNPDGLLDGARHMAMYGTLGFISCSPAKGKPGRMVVVDFQDPLRPVYVPTPQLNSEGGLRNPRRITFQFRYGFAVDADGVKVIHMTYPEKPQMAKDREGRTVVVPLKDARDIYVSRTYGYVAAGKDGLVILDLERPREPRRLMPGADFADDYNARAGINDARAVKIGMTNASLFAYVADGKNGLKVLQLTSPEDTPGYQGFSPRPAPRLIAKYHTHGPALAISEGQDRDRAVDEAGNQLSVFGRRGARPFTLEEQQRLFLRNGRLWWVDDDPTSATKLPEPQGATQPAAPQPPPKTDTPDPFATE